MSGTEQSLAPRPRSGRRSTRTDRLKWLGHRLAAMSPAEVLFRFGEQARRILSRHGAPDLAAMLADDARAAPSLPGLADGVRALREDEELIALWRSHARSVLGGRFHALGQDWPSGIAPPNWHVDPISGGDWPSDVYCFDIDYRDGQTSRGSARYALEMNRLQFLQPMAALAVATDDDEMAETVAGYLFSWIDQVTPYRGIQWFSGIEMALRTISMLIVSSLIGERSFDDDRRHRFLLALAAHGYWLDRFPSRYSSANNHLVAEAAALYLLGMLAPGLRPAKRWAVAAREELLQEVERQFHRDGVGAEQSPTYAAFTLDLFLLCAVVGERLGDPWPDASWQRMEAAGRFLAAITDRSGHQPRIGDDDEGAVSWLSRPRDSLINGVLGSLAAALGQADLAPVKPPVQLRNALHGTPQEPAAAVSGFQCFRDGGYSVSRFLDDGVETMLVLDHGPLGYLSIAAHGHADALAIWLHVDGKPLLIDAGTYQYASETEENWRAHFRSTPAHNTLSIAGDDSSVIAGKFNWSAKAEVTLRSVETEGETWAVEAEHDGFVDPYGYRHRRRVERLDEGLYQITDQLVGDGGVERVEIGFLMAPELEVISHSGGWLVSDEGRRRLYLRHEGPLKGWVERGIRASKRGWCSPSYGVMMPTSRLVFAGKLWPGATARFTLSTRFD